MDYRRKPKNTGTANLRSQLAPVEAPARGIVPLQPENQQIDTPSVPDRQFPRGRVVMKDVAKSHLPAVVQMLQTARARWKLYS